MCRVLAYLGKPILLEELLFNTNNSLITQTYDPKHMTGLLNLAGFGLSAWSESSNNPTEPYLYHNHELPFYDKNLKRLASKINANCLIAHVRGIAYSEKNVVSNQNAHPFLYDNTTIAFAHNGTLTGFEEMRYDLLHEINDKYVQRIQGTTDSEHMYALFLTCLEKNIKQAISIPQVFDALGETLDILKFLRNKHHENISSPLNFFISNGDFIVSCRFVFDYGKYPTYDYTSPHMGYHSLWYTYGDEFGLYNGSYQMKPSQEMKSIIVASEPLTDDSTTWIEVPAYSLVGASIEKEKLIINSAEIKI